MKNRNYKKTTQRNWDYLVTHFNPEYIEQMEDPKEYVIGFTSNNKSFCYLVEAGTIELGDIRGANSSKFGLWYGTHGEDKNRTYRTTKKNFDGDVDKAFKEIKIALAKLIRETIQLTEFKDLESLIAGMFKYKIMYLYNPKIMLPIFLPDDLHHFEDCLGLPKSKNYENAQKSLLDYRNSHFQDLNNHDFMDYLYKTFGRYNALQINEINENEDNQLNKKLFRLKDPTEEYITHPVEKAKLKKSGEGSFYYPRDPKVAAIALRNANHKCECDINHRCFIRRSANIPYTEVHHLIPLAYHYRFEKSLDIPENIVSLCSNCHNEIHYGRDADLIITKLFNERKNKLKEAGIDITLEQLLDMYHNINSQK